MQITNAIIDDALDVFIWRNDPVSRKMFFNSYAIPFEEHLSWFESSLASDLRKLFIGQLEGLKVGICRFDIDGLTGEAEVSVNLNPKMRGKGLSKTFLRLSLEEFQQHHKLNIFARIKKENLASINLFESVGFKKTLIKSCEYRYEFNRP